MGGHVSRAGMHENQRAWTLTQWLLGGVKPVEADVDTGK